MVFWEEGISFSSKEQFLVLLWGNAVLWSILADIGWRKFVFSGMWLLLLLS